MQSRACRNASPVDHCELQGDAGRLQAWLPRHASQLVLLSTLALITSHCGTSNYCQHTRSHGWECYTLAEVDEDPRPRTPTKSPPVRHRERSDERANGKTKKQKGEPRYR